MARGIPWRGRGHRTNHARDERLSDDIVELNADPARLEFPALRASHEFKDPIPILNAGDEGDSCEVSQRDGIEASGWERIDVKVPWWVEAKRHHVSVVVLTPDQEMCELPRTPAPLAIEIRTAKHRDDAGRKPDLLPQLLLRRGPCFLGLVDINLDRVDSPIPQIFIKIESHEWAEHRKLTSPGVANEYRRHSCTFQEHEQSTTPPGGGRRAKAQCRSLKRISASYPWS